MCLLQYQNVFNNYLGNFEPEMLIIYLKRIKKCVLKNVKFDKLKEKKQIF